MVSRFCFPDSLVIRTIVICYFVLASVSCATIESGSHFNESISIENYRTFSWISDVPYVRGYVDSDIRISPLTQEKIEKAIEAELVSKGYVFVVDRRNADFLASYTIGTRERLSVDAYPNYQRGDWAWHVSGDRYYDNQDISGHTYTEGTLGVDLFDRETGEPVWHGWAEKTITQSDRQDPSLTITTGVNQLLTTFPHSN